VIEHIKEMRPEDKIIVWTNWIPALKLLSRRMTEEGIKHVTYHGSTKDVDRQIAQDSYNADPSVKCFLGNPAAGGTGLDLWGYLPDRADEYTTNTTEVLYFSQDWSRINRSQSEDRAMRRGTRMPVRVIDVVVPGTIDEEIACRVLQKKMTADELQDVRDIMERLLKSVPNEVDDE
jgi:SNF2 family DNA or RNA helicase